MGMYASSMQGDAADVEVECARGGHWALVLRWGMHRVNVLGSVDELERIGADIVAAVARARHEHEAQVAANPPLDLAGVSS